MIKQCKIHARPSKRVTGDANKIRSRGGLNSRKLSRSQASRRRVILRSQHARRYALWLRPLPVNRYTGPVRGQLLRRCYQQKLMMAVGPYPPEVSNACVLYILNRNKQDGARDTSRVLQSEFSTSRLLTENVRQWKDGFPVSGSIVGLYDGHGSPFPLLCRLWTDESISKLD